MSQTFCRIPERKRKAKLDPVKKSLGFFKKDNSIQGEEEFQLPLLTTIQKDRVEELRFGRTSIGLNKHNLIDAEEVMNMKKEKELKVLNHKINGKLKELIKKDFGSFTVSQRNPVLL